MNPRTTALLVGVLLVLGGIAFFVERQHDAGMAPSSEKLFPTVVIDKVDDIEIQKQNMEVRLAKRNGQWIVLTEDEKPADPKLVDGLLADVDRLVNTDLVSSNPDNHALYEVAETGVTVKLSQDGKDVADFIVGKPGPDFNSSYIRPSDRDETYRVPVYLRTKVDRGTQPWRNRTLVDIPQSDVASYRTTDADGTVRFERSGDTWHTTEPFAGTVTQSDVMNIVLNSISKIVASGFADTVDAVTAGLDPAEKTVEIHTLNGEDYVVEIGRENPRRQTYTRLKGREEIYLVPVGRWNTVFRKAEEVATPDPEPGTEDGAGSGTDAGATGAPGAGGTP